MADTNSKKELFENVPVPKAIAIVAVPTIISQLINLIYNVADTFYVGRTGDPYKIAGVSLAFTIFFINISIANLFGVGGGSLLARLLGAGEGKRGKAVSAFSFYGALGAALLYSILIGIFIRPILTLLGASENTYEFARTYTFYVVVLGTVPLVLSTCCAHLLRNIGYSKQASLGLSGGGILNIILDPLFMFVIFPKGQEVFGAALATLISNVASMVYFILSMIHYSKSTVLSVHPKDLKKIEKRDIREVFSVGVPSALLSALFDIGMMVLNSRMAIHGDEQLAALGIVQKIERLPNAIGLGISQGMIPLIGYNYTSGNHKRMNDVIRTARIIGLSISFITIILYQIFAPYLAGFFLSSTGSEASEKTIAYATTFLRIRCCASFLMFLNYHSSYCMQSLGYGRGTLIHTVFRQVIFNIPIIFILDYFFGEIGLACTFIVSEALGAVTALILLKGFLKKNGVNDVEI